MVWVVGVQDCTGGRVDCGLPAGFCLTWQWNGHTLMVRWAHMEKRVKTDRIVLRVGEIEKRTIQGMADKAGLSLTDFILGRVWGDVQPVAAPTAVARAVDTPAPDDRDAKLAASNLPKNPVVVAKRPFNFKECRVVWSAPGYEHIGVRRNTETGQFWPMISNVPQSAESFDTLEEAQRRLDY